MTNLRQPTGNRSLLLRISSQTSQSSHCWWLQECGAPTIVNCKCPLLMLLCSCTMLKEPPSQASSTDTGRAHTIADILNHLLKQILKSFVLYLTGLLIPLLGMYTWTLRSDNGLVHAAFAPKTKKPNPPARAWVVCSCSGGLTAWSPYSQYRQEHEDQLSPVLFSPSTGRSTEQQEGARPKGFEAHINISHGKTGLLQTVSAITTSHFSEQSMTRKAHTRELH